MIFYEGQLMVLWRFSDLILLLFTGVLIQNILFLLFAAGHRFLEKKLSMCDIRRLMKLVLWYALILLPAVAGIVMFKATYTKFGPVSKWIGKGGESEHPLIYMNLESFSSRTAYGNHWIFLVILCVWIVGILVKGMAPSLRTRRVLKKLKRTKVAQPDLALTGIVRRLEKELGIKRGVEMIESPLLSVPFVTGWFRSRLYFPSQIRDEVERELLLCHELTHCRCWDGFYRRLLFLLGDLYWFNPFMHLFANYFVEVSEMACDEEVLEKCSSQEKKLYAKLLVSFETGEDFLRSAAALTGHAESGLERRLKNMKKKETKRSRRSVMLVTAVVLSMCPLATVSAASGVSVLQDRIIKMTFPNFEEEMNGIQNTLTEEVDYEDLGETRELGIHLGARGASIDTTLNGTGAVVVETKTLKKGDEIFFSVGGDKATDKFRVGWKDSSGKTISVTSTDGEIFHTFTIPKDDTYILFIQGTSSGTVHVTGRVFVK